jgi:hypothetical protein
MYAINTLLLLAMPAPSSPTKHAKMIIFAAFQKNRMQVKSSIIPMTCPRTKRRMLPEWTSHATSLHPSC